MTGQRVVAGPEGTRFPTIGHIAETGSTNADLLAEAARLGGGASSGCPVLVTDHQTAGRGRQSRAWHDEPGNSMLMSVLLWPGRSEAPLVPLVAGLAVTDAVGPDRASLKWPNDVLVPSMGERKLAGILAEATTLGSGAGGRLAVVVGTGLNLRWGSPPPDEIAARAATLEDVRGEPCDRWDVVSAVLAGLDRWLGVLEDRGRLAVLDEYRRRCLTIGRRVRLQRPADVVEGEAIAVDDEGALVVETGDGPITVIAGDAHHL